MSTVAFFRDSLTLDNSLPALLAAAKLTIKPRDTLVLGARLCTIAALPGDFNYVIGADNLTVATPALTVNGTGSNPSPTVTILAVEINGALNLDCRGAAGAPGTPGVRGDDGGIEIINNKPKKFPPTPGGNGGNGGAGSRGGVATVRFCIALQPPVATARGGAGGAAGAAGKAGKGVPKAADGKAGKLGASGAEGTATAAKVPLADIWKSVDFASALAWSAYRTEVGAHFFRVFDPGSQLIALGQFDHALQLNPGNIEAQTLRSRIIQRQTPTGLSRDIDISPDYKDLSANLGAEAILVQNAFAAAASAMQNLQTANGFKDQFTAMVQQLTDRAAEAQDNVQLAQQDVKIANAEERILSDQVASTRAQIDKLQNQSFDLGGFLTGVGSIVGSIASIATGLGAIVSVPSAIIALNNLDTRFGIVDVLNGEFAYLKDKDPKKDYDAAMGKVGKGLKAFMQAESNAAGLLVNMNAFERELEGAGSKTDQSQAAQLLKQLVTLQKQQMVARLRQAQARDRVIAAQRQTNNLLSEVQTAQGLLNTWTNTEAFLTRAVDIFIGSARHLIDIVAEDVFLARRALEIYQLERADDLRFDFGYLHPDQDRSVTPLERVTRSQISISALAPSILTWNSLFTRLNVAQAAGFQVVHPAVAVSITDPGVLAQLSSGRGLQFTIDASGTPASIFELKVNAMTLELEGASATSLVLFWMEHSGHWKMKSRSGGVVEFSLFPHIEAFNCSAATAKLTATIPALPQTSSEPGPPFSFWGRGVMADWRIFPDTPTPGLDLSRLTAVKLTIQCIGFASLGAGVQALPSIKPVVKVLPPRKVATARPKTAGAN